MNIADRIITQRKKCGWSQEELAEQLGVSRQSVSKWESGASTPDINRILEMSEIFGVTTDYILKGTAEEELRGQNALPATDISFTSERLMTVDEINQFMTATSEFGKRIARGVAMCILSPALLIGLAGFVKEADNPYGVISDTTMVLWGLVFLAIMIACAVMLFIRGGSLMSQYAYVKKGEFYLEQGSIDVIEGVLADFEPQFSSGIAKGVGLCIMSPIPLIATSLIGFPDPFVVLMVSALLLIVAVAVSIFIKMSVIKDGFLQLLKREAFDPIKKENARREEWFGGIYWPVIVAIYLLWSFTKDAWHMSWMIFPIAGLIFAAITNALKKSG